MASRNSQIRMVPIDAAMRARFERDAPAALARRTPAWFAEVWVGTLEWLLVAGVALVGLLLLDWSAEAMLGLMLASAVVGFAGDLVKGLLLRRQLEGHFRELHQDNEVWAVAEALMEGKQEVRADRVGSQAMGAGCGLFIDLTFGGMAVAGIVLGLDQQGISLVEPFRQDAGMRYVLLGLLGFQLVSLLWQLYAHTLGARRHTPMHFQAGGRGIGLFLLMFIVLFATDGGGSLEVALVVTNLALLGLVALAIPGGVLIRRETRWLRAHLHRRGPGARPAPAG